MANCPHCGKKPELESDAAMACGNKDCAGYGVWFPRPVWDCDDPYLGASKYINVLAQHMITTEQRLIALEDIASAATQEVRRLEAIQREIEKLPGHVFWIEKRRGEFLDQMQEKYLSTGENKFSVVADAVGAELGHFQLLKRELKQIIDKIMG